MPTSKTTPTADPEGARHPGPTGAVDVAACCDDHYVEHLVVMVTSAVSVTTVPLRLWVLGCDLSAGSHRMLESAADRLEIELSVVDLAAERLQGLPLTDHLTTATYARLFLPEAFPELDRVLYLDGDMIVTDDLATFPTDLDPGSILGAVVNPASVPRRPHLPGRPGRSTPDDGRPRFNSGVMLLDLAAMRSSGVSERVLALTAEIGPIPGCDQAYLNIVCEGAWTPLPLRWNVQYSLYRVPPNRLGLHADEVAEARRSPAIVHFSSSVKPWHYHCNHPERHRYHDYRARAGLPPVEMRPSGAGQRLKRAVKRVARIP